MISFITFSGHAIAGDSKSLEAVLGAQPEEVQARYGARHPQKTLKFFGIKPGMTVMEALPGGGWYSKILMSYLGKDGHLIGADYAEDMYPLFGFFSEEALEAKKTWTETWTAGTAEWGVSDAASVSAFQFGSMPEAMHGTADAVVLIRALHNLARFEPKGGYLTKALGDVYNVLKPGGIVGVVQHQARDEKPDEWANGSMGYLKRDFVIAQMEAAGFEFVGEKKFNNNPKDQPGDEDFVWRLPPSLVTSNENSELKEEMLAIGESNRMTLKFIKH
jgi:predicted methyltransferase